MKKSVVKKSVVMTMDLVREFLDAMDEAPSIDALVEHISQRKRGFYDVCSPVPTPFEYLIVARNIADRYYQHSWDPLLHPAYATFNSYQALARVFDQRKLRRRIRISIGLDVNKDKDPVLRAVIGYKIEDTVMRFDARNPCTETEIDALKSRNNSDLLVVMDGREAKPYDIRETSRSVWGTSWMMYPLFNTPKGHALRR